MRRQPDANGTSTQAQQRGRSYARQGRVEILHGREGRVHALVRGTRPYDVFVSLKDGVADMTCTCPHHRNRLEVCKHVWAVLVVGHEQGFFESPTPALRRMVPMADSSLGALPKSTQGPATTAKSRRWKTLVDSAIEPHAGSARETSSQPNRESEVLYHVDAESTERDGVLTIEVLRRSRKSNGKWSRETPLRLGPDEIEALPSADDRHILTALSGARDADTFAYRYYSSAHDRPPRRHSLPRRLAETLLPAMCRTGRCYLKLPLESPARIEWEDTAAWEPWLDVREASPRSGDTDSDYVVTMSFRRGSERIPIDAPALLVPGQFLFTAGAVAPLNDLDAYPWIALFRNEGEMVVPRDDGVELMTRVFRAPNPPHIDVPADLRFEEIQITPVPRLVIGGGGSSPRGDQWLAADLSFSYDGVVLAASDPIRHIMQAEQRRIVPRDWEAERRAEMRLQELSVRRARPSRGLGRFDLRATSLASTVRALLAEGWHVEGSAGRLRQAGEFRMQVTSGIDWFDLHGDVAFGQEAVSIPELLAAYRRGEQTVELGDGSRGLLPEEWLEKYAAVAEMGTAAGDAVRFRVGQVAILDALLRAQPDARVDERFATARRCLTSFEGIEPADPPPGFQGTLREYQRDGLGWLRFLAELGFGGCLADDMGLGKTVQVLALLEQRRHEARKPTLIVVPRSIIFNWKNEATRFTPELDVLDHTGPTRARSVDTLREPDVVLTTYGTLRRDVQLLIDVDFDYVILDESQAIKNAATASAKAARLLKADHRLALSGTPIENHLGELWSLFEFLNPGVLGTAKAFRGLGGSQQTMDDASREVIARAIRPFVLRRTKAQVAPDLPEKVEESLFCELGATQRRLYDELRSHYRAALTKRVATEGLNKSKILVLEALLRLRQAACHPGLVDPAKSTSPSAKVELLIEQLAGVADNGHKALVFSQFTKLLAIVRKHLDRDGVRYAYLDGRTRDRESCVETFQNDPDCQLFLISLKAGGVGLNLTAAEYVYLLDPWWNPAVEAQAVDRTHRIGQTERVFAYRVIAKDTVEERILELQQHKRDLADSIIKADATLIRSLEREDLELLLS